MRPHRSSGAHIVTARSIRHHYLLATGCLATFPPTRSEQVSGIRECRLWVTTGRSACPKAGARAGYHSSDFDRKSQSVSLPPNAPMTARKPVFFDRRGGTRCRVRASGRPVQLRPGDRERVIVADRVDQGARERHGIGIEAPVGPPLGERRSHGSASSAPSTVSSALSSPWPRGSGAPDRAAAPCARCARPGR